MLFENNMHSLWPHVTINKKLNSMFNYTRVGNHTDIWEDEGFYEKKQQFVLWTKKVLDCHDKGCLFKNHVQHHIFSLPFSTSEVSDW